MQTESNFDVVVVGGGPAGSSISKGLADLGHSVCLLERAAFPRHHVGICISEQTEELLEHVGLEWASMKTQFFERRSILVKWGTKYPVEAKQPGVHVDRGVLDLALIEAARSSGVIVLQPVRKASLHRGDGGWTAEIGRDFAKIRSRFLVEASGRANTRSTKRMPFGQPLFALHRIWQLERACPFGGIMEAGKDAWLWVACLPHNRAMVSVFTDPKHSSNNRGRGLDAYYHQMLGQFSLTHYFDSGRPLSKVRGCDATSRFTSEPIGDDFIRVGDVNFSVDPMASQGVHLALCSGIQGAVVVNTILRYPEYAESAKRFYRDRQRERISQFRMRTAAEYSRVADCLESRFWTDRASEARTPRTASTMVASQWNFHQKIKLCPEAAFVATPVLLKDRVCLGRALHHPRLDRPVAFLAGVSLFELLEHLKKKQTIASLVEAWESHHLSRNVSVQIIDWLWKHRIVIV